MPADPLGLHTPAKTRPLINKRRSVTQRRNPYLSNQVQVNLFDIWPAVDLCIRYGDRLDPETFENIKQVATTFVQYKDTITANLRTLAWVTRYLASEIFGEDAFTSLNITNYWRATDPNARAVVARSIVSRRQADRFARRFSEAPHLCPSTQGYTIACSEPLPQKRSAPRGVVAGCVSSPFRCNLLELHAGCFCLSRWGSLSNTGAIRRGRRA